MTTAFSRGTPNAPTAHRHRDDAIAGPALPLSASRALSRRELLRLRRRRA